MSFHIVLETPEIAQNTGTLIRLSACLGVTLHIIEPCGFVWSDKSLKRAALDYGEWTQVMRHPSWMHFFDTKFSDSRIIAATPKGESSLYETTFKKDDILIFGRESVGLSEEALSRSHATIHIPMRQLCRSLNLAISVSIVVSEALRQVCYDIP